MSKFRNYCFTINNYSDDDIKLLSDLSCKYLIFGKEVGDSGTPHLQGYVMFKSQRSFNSVKKLIPNNGHIEVAKGSPLSNFEYCSKDGDFIEVGERPKGSGKRTDIDLIKDMVKDKCSDKDIFEAASSFQAFRFGQIGRNIYMEHRSEKPCCIWLHGKSGVGKSKFAFDNSNDIYVKDSTKWWDGYEQNEVILIDDFDGGWPFRDFLKLLDRYPYQGQYKGGYVKINSPVIIVTCEFPPDYFWADNELAQVTRRFDNIVLLDHGSEVGVILDPTTFDPFFDEFGK